MTTKSTQQQLGTMRNDISVLTDTINAFIKAQSKPVTTHSGQTTDQYYKTGSKVDATNIEKTPLLKSLLASECPVISIHINEKGNATFRGNVGKTNYQFFKERAIVKGFPNQAGRWINYIPKAKIAELNNACKKAGIVVKEV